MHEMSITQEILRIAVEHAGRAGAKQITDIHLVIGALSSVVDDSVQFYFDFLSPNTVAEGARLHFARIDAKLQCRQCGQEFEPQGMNWNCPCCNAVGGEILAGKEFYVDSIEVE
ncbi:MAG: hydrogenase maturation nickel metallochaperone HypA [Anaerolineae bacterium]|nr:hydrogenase maturation nickel metallochaperone HypA [Anaerolineae bacterium]